MHEAVPSNYLDEDMPEDSKLLEVLEKFSQFLDELYDTSKPTVGNWEGNTSGMACRRLQRVLEEWRRYRGSDEPPLALVVRLARRLTNTINEIAKSPRVILQRRRTMEPLHRLREMDSGCMQWLVKQPGRSLLEKTGNKRATMVVQRFESLDTLENRVYVDFLKRALSECDRYLREYQPRFPDHSSVLATQSFKRRLKQVLAKNEFREVSDLPSVPQPNYALLHESRYHQIWWGYQLLIRQHVRRRQLWFHRESAWSELLYISLLCSLERMAREADGAAAESSLRFDCWIQDQTRDGQKISQRSYSPIWHVRGRDQILVARTGELRNLTNRFDNDDPHLVGVVFFSKDGLIRRSLKLSPHFTAQDSLLNLHFEVTGGMIDRPSFTLNAMSCDLIASEDAIESCLQNLLLE